MKKYIDWMKISMHAKEKIEILELYIIALNENNKFDQIKNSLFSIKTTII